ncbi:hypothetical protein O6H91_04G056400 [Diphasiastrum complanatum]|uniref:Uncharacterized protein n=1 Tax=Diphasiastrum complanatum TaxID=34168 RepID=A0ACC2DX99_DIPCM|nr:hypothetical protein O6H91_04G056400 [Diphasiastrum complanatum]
MKPLNVSKWLGLVFLVLIGSYYFGRPVYWEIMSRILDSQSSLSSSYGSESHGELEAKQSLENAGKQEKENVLVPDGPEYASGIENHKISANASKDGARYDDKKQGIDTGSFAYELLKRPIWEAPSIDSQMPPLQAFALSKEMVDFRAKKNVIVVTFANHAFLDFALNWVKHLTQLRVSNILVGAMDHKCLEALFWAGIPTFDMGHQMDVIDVGWGTPSFHKMGREKVILVNEILSFGYELLMCDTDMVWMKDPLPYLEQFPEADVLTSSDAVVSTVDDDQLEVWDRSFGAYNIGIFHWRPSAVSKNLAKVWREQLLGDDSIWDQNGFNELMQKQLGPSVIGHRGLFYAYDGSLKLGVLPVSIFCSGHTFFVQAMYKQLKLAPYAVHTTFQFAGTDGKRHRLREAKLFHDKPEYYDLPGGFVSFNTSVPEHLLTGGIHSIESHFALVNYQVMPALWCRFDRMWFGHPGILPGTKTQQPFLCPMDHIFEVNNMLKQLPEEEFGPSIRFREYSFLENPRLPEKVKTSKLQVDICDKDASDCNLIFSLGPFSQVYNLARHNTEDQLFAALFPFRNVKHVHFSSIMEVFEGFINKAREEKFRRRVKTYTGIWCCVENRERGHIYYDIYWDEKPDWKPLPPSGPEDDHPPW